jgi:hypothetical protein
MLPTVRWVSSVAKPPISALMKMKTVTPSATPTASSADWPGLESRWRNAILAA